MPPKKKARVQSKSDKELEKLVKWVRDCLFRLVSFSDLHLTFTAFHHVQLSRGQLEGFVMAAVRDGSLPVEELWNCAPERAVIQIRKTGSEAPVEEGDDRVGSYWLFRQD